MNLGVLTDNIILLNIDYTHPPPLVLRGGLGHEAKEFLAIAVFGEGEYALLEVIEDIETIPNMPGPRLHQIIKF